MRINNQTVYEPNKVNNIEPLQKQMPRGGENELAVPIKRELRQKLIPQEERVSTLEDIFDEKTLKRMGIVECSTCASRTYQDQSNDASVSFQAPTHLSPAQAASAVVSHEMEHVSNEQAYAKAEGKEVISQSVSIFRSVCPECGKSYVSGGLTKTTTAQKVGSAYGEMKAEKGEGNLMDYDS